ncbi:MAG: DnaJ domain [Blastocatellia bacterium]
MNDCWKQLGLQPTTDLAAIKRAYREQVKRYHPDTVMTPEQKRRYTIICAAINEAYREAVRCAQAANAAQPSADDDAFADAPHQDTNEFRAAGNPFEYAPPVDQPNALGSFFKSPTALRTLLLLFLGFEIIIFFAGPMQNVPTTVQTLAGVFITLFVGFIIYGLLVAGALDLLIFWFFPRRLLDLLGLAKYESKLIWLVILAANGFVFFFTRLIAHPSHHQVTTAILDIAVRMAATVTVPLIIALLWLRDLVRYRRIKQDGVALAEPL